LKELEQVNHMFSFHTFTAKTRICEAKNDRVTEMRHKREKKDAVRVETWQRRLQECQDRKSTNVPCEEGATPREIAQRNNYQFEADSDNDKKEMAIERNLVLIQKAARRMKGIARAHGSEIERQNIMIEGMKRTVDRVDDKLAVNQAKLRHFH
jgi:uncharacterized protein YydD (DUF2326 family)